MKRLLLEMDLAGAEWVVVAYASGDANMMNIVQSKKSPHVETAKLITGLSEDIILRENKLLGHCTDPIELEEVRRKEIPELFSLSSIVPRNMTIRQMAKKSNHGLNYLMTAPRFSMETEMDQSECSKIIDLYTKRAYVNLPVWWKAIENQLRVDRTVENCFGRKRRFLDEWTSELIKAAVAFVPQSTVSDIVTAGMKRIYADEDLMSRMDLLANVHDSLLFQFLVSDLKQAAHDIIKCVHTYMRRQCSYGGRDFFIDVDAKVGHTWGHMEEVKVTKDVDHLARQLKEILTRVEASEEAA